MLKWFKKEKTMKQPMAVIEPKISEKEMLQMELDKIRTEHYAFLYPFIVEKGYAMLGEQDERYNLMWIDRFETAIKEAEAQSDTKRLDFCKQHIQHWQLKLEIVRDCLSQYDKKAI
jgi:hypothetical protein